MRIRTIVLAGAICLALLAVPGGASAIDECPVEQVDGSPAHLVPDCDPYTESGPGSERNINLIRTGQIGFPSDDSPYAERGPGSKRNIDDIREGMAQ